MTGCLFIRHVPSPLFRLAGRGAEGGFSPGTVDGAGVNFLEWAAPRNQPGDGCRVSSGVTADKRTGSNQLGAVSALGYRVTPDKRPGIDVAIAVLYPHDEPPRPSGGSQSFDDGPIPLGNVREVLYTHKYTYECLKRVALEGYRVQMEQIKHICTPIRKFRSKEK